MWKQWRKKRLQVQLARKQAQLAELNNYVSVVSDGRLPYFFVEKKVKLIGEIAALEKEIDLS